jgi:hypothetical protein
MNRTQLSNLYDSFPESQRDMPKEQFIRKAMDAQNPVKNRKILSAMVDRKCQIKRGQIEKATIDSALKRNR